MNGPLESIILSDLGLIAAQVRAARALLGWSQSDLAKNVKVSRSAIADLEGARRRPHEATMFVIFSELSAAGVNFTGTGVEFRQYPLPKSRVS
ncbi:helix-turn-helix domain-containing protein [Aureimonas frigidaquae]|uniref:helix-turn-helix domain-containing protein n=1 Tax=Aureimonas frigidaquae TaxID=424757 RepID=UPI001FCCEC64|nr:helix-turn-helix transcriptional regulator [Aureimonas frigidaquae]